MAREIFNGSSCEKVAERFCYDAEYGSRARDLCPLSCLLCRGYVVGRGTECDEGYSPLVYPEASQRVCKVAAKYLRLEFEEETDENKENFSKKRFEN